MITDVLKGKLYLTGYYLGVWVYNMVKEKGLRVTVMLDSCYSGASFQNTILEGLTPRMILGAVNDLELDSDAVADATINKLNPALHETSDSCDLGNACNV
jgi:hypothetical protein